MARHVWKEMLFTISMQIWFFLLFWPAEKGTHFKLMNFHLKKREIQFETLCSPSFDVLHSSPMVYMDHTEIMFHDLLFYCAKKVPESHNHFFSLSSQGWNILSGACSDLDVYDMVQIIGKNYSHSQNWAQLYLYGILWQITTCFIWCC